jgi:hypothetical protein
MTEAEWLGCNDIWPMLDFLRGKASSTRKGQLFVCSNFRRSYLVWNSWKYDLKKLQRIEEFIEASERQADVPPHAAKTMSVASLGFNKRAGDLLRDIMGNPFRPVTADPRWMAWNGGAVVKLAQAAYEERALPSGELDLARLAVLADALEESGCSITDVLDHLRGPGPHVRGCWVIDLLLGKS